VTGSLRVALVSSARWSSFRLSKHFVALALANLGHDVLYVEPPVSPLSLVRHRQRWADLRHPRDEQVQDRLWVWGPRVLPGQNSAAGQRANAVFLARGVRSRLGRPDVVIAFSLEARGVVAALDEPTVYHCTDSQEDLPGIAVEAAQRRERELCRLSQGVAACSLPLTQQLVGRGVEAAYIPHGCDAEFAGATARAEFLAGPRPWVGFIGSVNFRLDADLLARTAASHPGTTFVVGARFGGAPEPGLRSALAHPRLVALGQQPPSSLPGLMASLDVGVVPYREIPFNRKSFPIKIPQHLATGVPVVSTANGATDEFGGLTHLASVGDWEDVMEKALALNGSGAAERREAGGRRSWEQVAQELLGLVT